ncbi:MAG: diguanylate cyclase [Nautiliaceae bacterium]
MRILIVESNDIYAKLLKKSINKYLVFAECDTIHSFKELLHISDSYDLYLCDCFLPDALNAEHIHYLLNKTKNIIILTNDDFQGIEIKSEIIESIEKDDYRTIEYLINFIKRLHKNKSLNVLVVDDSIMMLEYKKNLLEKVFFNVFLATNGYEALKMLDKYEINMVISDLDMPVMDGCELLLNIRDKHSMSELPVIVISEYDNTKKFLRALKYGANDYIKKPFLKEEFILRVNNLFEIYENVMKIKKQAQIDPLTSAYNRLFLENYLDNMFNLHDLKSVVMLDIDYFKKINDTYGHQVGDSILKHFVKTIKQNIRKADYIVRYGGEEFLIYMPNTSKKEALFVVEKIRRSLQAFKNIKYTFSAGIADEGETLSMMIKLADERLYKAKKNGRNRTVIE